MIEINLNNVKKSYGFKNILDGINLEIKTNDRVSIIGDNGVGKTTLLNIITSKEDIDSGTVSIRKGAVFGYLNQQPENIYQEETVKQILYDSLEEINELEKKLKIYEEKMQNNPTIDIINKYIKIQEKFMNIGGYEINTLIEKVSHGLNIDFLDKKFKNLSGGEQKRVMLASLIIKKPNILILDEPTNHLDIETLEWLENFLNKYDATIIIVSHDRYFLDKVTNKTILIENGKAIIFHGNYSKYLEENELRIEKEFKEYKDQQKVITAMKKKIKQLEEFGKLAYPYGENFFKRAENIRKRLERIELKDKPVIKKEIPLNLEIDKRTGKDVLVLKNYNLKINDITLIENINLNIRYKEKVCIIGKNGCGKTTLIKEIIKNIKLGSNVKIGYIEQQINFENDETVLEYARKHYSDDESHLRSELNKFYFHKDNVFKKISKLSGGEKVRLKLFELIHEKCNFLILDEPTNHVDIYTKETLEEALKEYQGTILFISHDRYFINKIASKIIYIYDKKLKEYDGNYTYFIEHKNMI